MKKTLLVLLTVATLPLLQCNTSAQIGYLAEGLSMDIREWSPVITARDPAPTPKAVKWVENPIAVNVGISGWVTAESNAPVTFIIGGVTNVVHGLGTTEPTNFTAFFALIKTSQSERLYVHCTNLAQVHIDLLAPSRVDMSAGKTLRGSRPRGFRTYIDNVQKVYVEASPEGGPGSLEKEWQLRVESEKAPGSAITEEPVPENVVAGDGGWLQIGPGLTAQTNMIGIKWEVHLGRLRNANSAGKLRIGETIDNQIAPTPEMLIYSPPVTNQNEINVVTNGSSIAQIRTPQVFVNVVTNSTGFQLAFYTPTNLALGTNAYGLNNSNYYDLVAQAAPYVTWEFANILTNGTNRIYLLEYRGSITNESRLEYASTNAVWSLTSGSGSDWKVERRHLFFEGNPATNRFETNTLADLNGTIAFKVAEKYHYYPWGWELVSTTTDPDGAPLTQTQDYYSEGTPEDGYGQLKQITYPDGYWEKRTYIYGALHRILKPWKNSPASPDDATYANSAFTEYTFATTTDDKPYISSSHDVYGPQIDAEYEDPYQPAYVQLRYHTAEDEEGGTIYTEETDNGWWNGSGPRRKKSTYTALAGEFLGGKVKMTANGWLTATHYIYQLGDFTNGTFTANTNGLDMRECAIWGFKYWEGNTLPLITEWHGIAFGPIEYWPGISTNVTKIYQNGNLMREETYVLTSTTNQELIKIVEYQRDYLGRLTAMIQKDPLSGVTRQLQSHSWVHTNGNSLPYPSSTTDAGGKVTEFAYDGLKRRINIVNKGYPGDTIYPSQPDQTNLFAYNASDLPTNQLTIAGNFFRTNTTSYDLSKRAILKQSPFGVTNITYSNGGRTIETTLPGGGTIATNYYYDRRLASVTGSAVISQYLDYTLLDGFIPQVGSEAGEENHLITTIHYGSTNSPRTYSSHQDFSGNLCLEQRKGYFETNNATIITHLRDWIWDDDRSLGNYSPTNGMVQSRYIYNDLADYGALQMLRIPQSATERIRYSYSLTRLIKIGDAWFRYTTNSVCLVPLNTTNRTIVSISQERVTGLLTNVISELVSTNYDGSCTTNKTLLNASTKQLQEIESRSTSLNQALRVTVNGLLQEESSLSISNKTQYQYDALGRRTSVLTPKGITLYTAYNPELGLLVSATDFSGNTNVFDYYPTNHISAHQLKSTTDARGKTTYHAFNGQGQTTRTWGDVPYPEERAYNEYGDMTALHTFRAGTNWQSSTWPTNSVGSSDITRWTYQDASGLLIEKVDAKSNKWTFTYDSINLPIALVWSRTNGGGTLGRTNIYNTFGEIVGIRYSDDRVFSITNLNQLGLPQTVIDDSGTHSLAYDAIGRVISDTFNGVTNSYTYNQYGRALLSISVGTNTVSQTNAYDSATGRLLTIGANSITATYSYLTNADLVSGVVFSNSTGVVLTTAKTFEYSSRLKSITNILAGGSNVSSHVYLYDAIHRRTNSTLADGSYWRYGYDDRSQLTSAKRYWSGGGIVAGQQYEYSYDSIGNRTVTQSGGSQFGTSLRTATWTVNELNQTITNAAYGYVNIFGEADASATVTVNHESVYRNGNFFRKELLFSNSSGPVYPSITNVAVINNYGTNGEDIVDQVIGNVWVPKNPETLLYDEDGNLIQDSRWVYRWDAENRLKEMETLSGLATNVPVQKLVFTYDSGGRRTSKAVYAWSQSITNYQLSSLTRFVYDGWNLLAELDVPQGTNAPILTKSFLWGLDLSGLAPDKGQKAGGIGGLLAITSHLPSPISHLPCFDGIGNVMALLKADSSTLSAKYEYAPFGEPLRVTGDAALLNPFRFSTKYTDDETGLLYYGYRYYSPSQGKWTNRDPLEEEGGINLYAFVQNNPIGAIDPDGRSMNRIERLVYLGTLAVTGRLVSMGETGLDIFWQWDKDNNGERYGKAMKPVVGNPLITSAASARLETITMIGKTAEDLFRGELSGGASYSEHNPYSKDGLAVSFLQNVMNGDTAMADLDSILLAQSIAFEGAANGVGSWTRGGGTSGLLGVIANSPNYRFLNAWDTLETIANPYPSSTRGTSTLIGDF